MIQEKIKAHWSHHDNEPDELKDFGDERYKDLSGRNMHTHKVGFKRGTA